jgi:hypothetical protein
VTKQTKRAMTANLKGEIREILDQIQIVKNASRKDFVGKYVVSLIQSDSVQFHRVGKNMIDDIFRVKSRIDEVITPLFAIFARFIIKNLKLLHHTVLVV